MEGLQDHIPSCVQRLALLRYAGYGGQAIGPSLEGRIDEAIALVEATAAPRACWRSFPVGAEGDALVLEGSILRIPAGCGPEGLRRSSSITVGALTLGAAIDRTQARLSRTDSVLAVLFDAAASALIEDCADRWERSLGARVRADQGLYPGQRLSPGYSGLPLELSDAIGAVLDAPRTVGIYGLPGGLLQPQKSITVLVPFFRSAADARAVRYSCDNCESFEGCPLRNGGSACYRR